jgi:SurA N-terminal domain.
MKNRKLVAVVAGVIAIAGVAAGAAWAMSRGSATTPAEPSRDLGPVIATVDGQPVYLAEMQSRVQGIQSVHGDFEKTLGKDWPDKLLQNLVDDKIVEQQAAALGIVVTDAQVQANMDKLRAMFTDDQQFQDWLAQGQMSLAELTDRVRLQAVTSTLYLKATEDVTVSSDEAHAYWEAHPDKYPGIDGGVASFLSVRSKIEEDLLKKARDRAYGAWLDEQRTKVDVVVVMSGWWKEIA